MDRRRGRGSRAPVQVVALVAVVLAALTSGITPARAQDPRAEQQKVRRQKAEKAQEINVLKASDAQVAEALDALNANVVSQQARAAAARQAASVAALQAKRARAREAATAAKLRSLQLSLKGVAVDAYMRGPSEGITVALDSPSLQAMAVRQHLLRVAASKGGDTADQLRATREDLQIARQAAERAQQAATARKRAVDDRLQEAKRAATAQERVAAQVEDRLESALAEAASLDALDQKLSADIRARQARLAARVAGRLGSGRGTRAIGRVGAVNLSSVRGITVAAEIAGRLEQLLAAADADGFSLGGGGYRSSEGQVAARRAHCGSSEYDVYSKPASSCHPPTARPGASMHERGLAIDFTSGGSLIQSRGNPAYRWLAANAGRYGLRNLPREPWHWSTNGQ